MGGSHTSTLPTTFHRESKGMLSLQRSIQQHFRRGWWRFSIGFGLCSVVLASVLWWTLKESTQEVQLSDGSVLRYETATFGKQHEFRPGVHPQLRAFVCRLPLIPNGWLEPGIFKVAFPDDRAIVWLSWCAGDEETRDTLNWEWRCTVIDQSGQETACESAGDFLTPNTVVGICSIPQLSETSREVKLRIYDSDDRLAAEFSIPNPWSRE